MKIAATVSIIAFLLAPCGFARLGEVPQECARRYGQPIERVKLQSGSGYEYHYERGNYEISIRYVRSNKTVFQPIEAGYISYVKKDRTAFDRQTLETLLDRNLPDQILFTRMSRDMFWEEVKKPTQENIDREWIRKYRYHEYEDGKRVEKTDYAEARANLSDDNVLVISSHFPLPRGYKNWEERQEAIQEQTAPSSTDKDF